MGVITQPSTMKRKLKTVGHFAPFVGFVCVVLFLVWLIPKFILRIRTQNVRTPTKLNYEDESVYMIPTPKPGRAKPNQAVKIPIVMYHYVENVKDQNDTNRKKLSIAPSLFESHLKQLRQARYETYFVRDIPDILNGSIDYSTQSAVLTFDDGYDDFYTTVFPLLKKYHMRATVYVITNFVGRRGFLTEKQIRELIDSGIVEVGSHTLDHLYLKKTTVQVSKRQIEESKIYFEKTYGLHVQTFAYPYGAFNEDTIQQVKDAGYTAAVSVISSELQSMNTLFILGRVRPGLFPNNNIISFIEKYNK